MQKKLLSLVLMLIAAINTFAYRDFTVDGIRYQILSEGNGTCAVCGHEELTKSTLTIPSIVTNWTGSKYTVKSIGDEAFIHCSELTSINIPEGLTEIGSSAFKGCSGLTSINIPEGVTIIGSSAFSGCSGLTSINIPEGVTEIGGSAFAFCSGLTSINIPESVTYIGISAFYGCRVSYPEKR